MKVLGIETSCDETAVAVLEVVPRRIRRTHCSEFIGPQARGEEITVLSNVISSQVKIHAKYGGVVPNLAAREHTKNIEHVFRHALKKAGIWGHRMSGGHPMSKIDLITVTRGPGLGPSLLVGIAFARTLAWKHNKPLVGVNHLEGHIYSNWLKPVGVISNFEFRISKRNSKFKIQNIFPALNLVVSGGHTELVLMESHGKYKIIGETLDDAVGEAFDKVSRLLGLGYPGGPVISWRAEKWNIDMPTCQNIEISFPRPMINSKNYNFSYAGLKTSVLYKVRNLESTGIKLTNSVINQICYEFQKAALDVLIFKTIKAAQEYKVSSVFLSGGVSANKELRRQLETETNKLGTNYFQPELEYATDNAAMIAAAGYCNYTKGKKRPQDLTWDKAKMDANLGL